jgi:glycosyltransferase involved in cell wall biosynthesis
MDLPLKIVGDGPEAERLQAVARGIPAVEWLGAQPHVKVKELMADAMCLIVPSVWYEGLPLVAVESLSCGTPIVASRIGALAELVSDGRNGVLFEAGNPADLAAKLSALAANSPTLNLLRSNARADYESKYTAARNYILLMAAYARALGVEQSKAFVTQA